jgi:glycosyltransferase involved in cell wall biosynthesis
MRGIPVVLHVHGSNHLEEFYNHAAWRARFVRTALRRVDHVVVVSRYMEERIRKWMGTDFPVTHLYNPVAVHDFDPPSGLTRTVRPTVLFIGWIIEAKGIFDLLAVVPQLAEKHPNVLVRFGGDGMDMARFRDAAAQSPCHSNLDVAGWITGDAKRQAYTGADIFCLPSHSEGLPISVLEAMSARLPVVATCISGIPEEVVDGETGLLFTPGDRDALVEHLLSLLGDPVRAQVMGLAGRARAEAHFDRDAVAAQLVQLWTSIVR